MGATYPLITVVTLRALDTVDDGGGGRRLPGALGSLPAAVQEVVHVSGRGAGGGAEMDRCMGTHGWRWCGQEHR